MNKGKKSKKEKPIEPANQMIPEFSEKALPEFIMANKNGKQVIRGCNSNIAKMSVAIYLKRFEKEQILYMLKTLWNAGREIVINLAGVIILVFALIFQPIIMIVHAKLKIKKAQKEVKEFEMNKPLKNIGGTDGSSNAVEQNTVTDFIEIPD
jgi:hypothetical protein